MKRALIVGCDGQDGKLLFDFLVRKDYEVIGIDRNIFRSTKRYEFDAIDIRNKNDVFELIRTTKPCEVYYLAGFSQSSEDRPIDNIELFRVSNDIHAFSLINFLEAIKTYSFQTKLFYAASSHIYGDTPSKICSENTPINPNTIYGITKATGFFICRFYRRQFSIFASTGILFNHESTLRSNKYVSSKIIYGAINIKKNIQNKLQLGDLNAEADWGYAPDYIEAMYRILCVDTSDDFVIATGKRHTVLDFVKKTFGYLNLDWTAYVEENSNIMTRKNIFHVGNSRKLRLLTGWKPSVTFDEMIQLIIVGQGLSTKKLTLHKRKLKKR